MPPAVAERVSFDHTLAARHVEKKPGVVSVRLVALLARHGEINDQIDVTSDVIFNNVAYNSGTIYILNCKNAVLTKTPIPDLIKV